MYVVVPAPAGVARASSSSSRRSNSTLSIAPGMHDTPRSSGDRTSTNTTLGPAPRSPASLASWNIRAASAAVTSGALQAPFATNPAYVSSTSLLLRSSSASSSPILAAARPRVRARAPRAAE